MRSERIIEMANSQQHPNGDDYEKRVLYIAIHLGRWSSEKLLNKGETLCQSTASELSQNALAVMELGNVERFCGGAKNAAPSVV